MADKEVSIYIIDLGASMGACNSGRTESNLDWSMRYVWDRLFTTIAASRTTWKVSIVGLRTKETRNQMAEESGYENISVLEEVGPISMSTVRSLKKRIKAGSTMNGDAVSSIVVAMGLIDAAAPQRLKYKRKIILVTDGMGAIDSDDFEDISSQINKLGIEVTVLGVDFDDAEYGFKEEDKPPQKVENEQLLRSFVGKCTHGVLGTMAEAVEELELPRLKSTRPYKTYDGPLTVGDPGRYESAIAIDVERYFMTKVAAPPAASNVVKPDHDWDGSQSTQTVDGAPSEYMPIRHLPTYQVDDPDAAGKKKDVKFEDLAKGYEYGRTAVFISELEFNITKLETTKHFSILGFVQSKQYEPFLNMGEACVTVARKFHEKSELALSALITAMYDSRVYAVARLVPKDWREPQLLLLMPSMEPDLTCLYDVPLPFAEDVRAYQFPPLDRVLTVTGGVLTKHRLLPNDQLCQAMSDYVDAMDISSYGTDSDGKPAEYAPIDDNFSPMIHRVNQAIKLRAIHPNDPFEPATGGVLDRFSNPPEDLVKQAKDEINALIKVADVKKVPPKAKGKRGRREQATPLSGLDVDALLGQAKRTKISAENSVPEFKQALKGASEVHQVEELVKQMAQVVRSLISTSTGDLGYGRAAENMRVMREELVELEEPGLYNSFLRDLKAKIAAEELGGPRLDMWWMVRRSGLGLITSHQSDKSDVSDEAAQEFLRYVAPAAAAPTGGASWTF